VLKRYNRENEKMLANVLMDATQIGKMVGIKKQLAFSLKIKQLFVAVKLLFPEIFRQETTVSIEELLDVLE